MGDMIGDAAYSPLDQEKAVPGRQPRKALTLATLLLAAFAINLDATIINLRRITQHPGVQDRGKSGAMDPALLADLYLQTDEGGWR
jgi:hypothetical protein